ncbi:MAG: DUF3801 domain-containing protein [Saccharofermentans sp.]|nr:DUF3801 domain-containing protein [Saccharofermentans sp.]
MADEVGAAVQLLSVSINGTEKLCHLTAYVGKLLYQLLTKIFLKVQANKELSPGEKAMVHFLRTGKTLQCLTMTEEQYKKFEKNAAKYGIQYSRIDSQPGKEILDENGKPKLDANGKVMREENHITVFIPDSDAAKFNALVKDCELNSIENHGKVTPTDEKIDVTNVKKVLSDHVKSDGTLDLKSLRDELIKNGFDKDEVDDMILSFVKSESFQELCNDGKLDPWKIDIGNIPEDKLIYVALYDQEKVISAYINPDKTVNVDKLRADIRATGYSPEVTNDYINALVNSDIYKNMVANGTIKDTFVSNESIAFKPTETWNTDLSGDWTKDEKIVEERIQKLDGKINEYNKDPSDKGEVYIKCLTAERDYLALYKNNSLDTNLEDYEPFGSDIEDVVVPDAAAAVSELKNNDTKSYASHGEEGGHGNNNYEKIVNNPLLIGKVESGPNIAPDITPPTPSAGSGL